ncbi:MAG: alpha-amylase, partial [Saprospiraceae bacterium]|nr:alpha-amylase [Saprospiraceae bacterium]
MKFTLGVLIALVIISSFVWVSCRSNQKQEATTDQMSPKEWLPTNQPDWAKNAVIYEVNVRQYTPEGTFNAFSEHIDRLKDLGVDILWFMPVFPISEKNKKGELGSYYAVSNYREVNPEFGAIEDFDAMVQKVHDAGMKIIIDWVPNHTGWDHVWLATNKEFYTRDSLGNVIDPIDPETGKSWGWTDVADLNYDNAEMRQEMIASMQYWLDNHNIDGLRVDVAHNVPNDFWDQVQDSLGKGNYPYMLAEGEVPYHRNSGTFAMDYAWSFHHLMNDIAKGEKPASAIDTWLKEDRAKYERGYHMQFITNHDENAWNGTEYERMGDGVDAFAVLTFTFEGMPLIYTGQEAAYNKRMEFFQKDPVDWGTYEKTEFYKKLIDLKHRNQALWNGEHGGE